MNPWVREWMKLLKINDTALVIVDVQGKLAKIMHQSKEILANVQTFIQGAQLLDIPIVWLEQYPKGLGGTLDEVKQHLVGNKAIEKMTFSACKTKTFQEEIKQLGKKSILVAGIEAHICVYQTVAELLQQDYDVEVIVDAVSSRTLQNKEIGIEKMKSLGAQITSVEMALFELMETAEHPVFKQVSKLIK